MLRCLFVVSSSIEKVHLVNYEKDPYLWIVMDLKIDMLGGTLAGILIWSAQG